ncbi:MAG: type II toxin-antitoxin system PemK/MazF family toxin [Nanoarchaeota archaeon]|nr:type II toxin-antitoxin system PemK/MazF family toxin [Nanoarchaeota archaeon]
MKFGANITISQRDLFLVPFPFSDQKGRKVRPVVIISNNNFNEFSEDVLVVGVTSNISKDKYALRLANKDLVEGKLLTECCIKCENILRVDKGIFFKKIGKISGDKFDSLRKIILEIIS